MFYNKCGDGSINNIFEKMFKQNDNFKSVYSFGKDGNESTELCVFRAVFV